MPSAATFHRALTPEQDNRFNSPLPDAEQKERASRHGRSVPSWCEGEPSIDEILADPIVRAMMRADGVELAELAQLLVDVEERRLNGSRSKEAPARRLIESCSETGARSRGFMGLQDPLDDLRHAYLLGLYDEDLVIGSLRVEHGLSAIETMQLMREWDDERRRAAARQSA
jgi:hypothetical protein